MASGETVAAVVIMLVLSGCSMSQPVESAPSSPSESSTSVTHATATTVDQPTTTTVTTTSTATTTTPAFGSAMWIGTQFSVTAEPSLGFGVEYTVGEPRHAEVVVGGEPTGLWIWEATYETPRFIVVGQGPSPYLRTISEDDDVTTTTTAPQDPSAVHDLMLWSVVGAEPGVSTIRDTLPLRLTSGFLATYDGYGDCFYGNGGRNLFGFIDPNEWNIQITEEGDWIGADDIRPWIVFDTAQGSQIELIEPSLVTCKILY